MEQFKEEAVSGTTSGLINKEDTVTWKGKHLFKTRQFTTKITAMKIPDHFTDEMLHGDFKSFHHQHHFKQIDNGTIMIDILEFETPCGALGKLFSAIFLKKYLQKFLQKRNITIKEYAETQKWEVTLS